MNRVGLAVISCRGVALVVAALALGCDGTHPSPTAPRPAGTAQNLAAVYFGTQTLASTSASGVCSSHLAVGFSQQTAWSVTISGSDIVLNWDPASGDDVTFTGSLSGDAFSAEYEPPPAPASSACALRASAMAGTFSSDRLTFDANVVEWHGSGDDEMRVEWLFSMTARS